MIYLASDFPYQLFTMPEIIFVVGGAVGVIGIVFGSMTCIISTRARERTKREIAAYVAEGTIDPDKAVTMLKACGADEDDD